MKVLMITGDKNFEHSGRFALQAAQVDKLEVLYWGRGALFPRLPQEKFDVVTSQDPLWRGLFAWHIARKLGIKLNVQVHTDLAAQPLMRRMLARTVLRHANSIRVVSEKIKKQIERMNIAMPIHVLPIFVDIERFKAVVRRPSVQKTILWIGRFESEKDPASAIRIFKEVCAAGIDAKLVMLGKGSLEQSLRALADSLAVEFPGWRDTQPYLAEASVVLCTSQHESWGASIVEALAAGVPVVAPDVGIAREAGAIIAKREELAIKVAEVLKNDTRGELKLSLPSAGEWAEQWKVSLQ